MDLLDSFEVEIIDDPYGFLMSLTGSNEEMKSLAEAQSGNEAVPSEHKDQICLRLYAVDYKGNKYVPVRSGLNQWNALGRERNADEVYISYPVVDRNRTPGFFPPRKVPFRLRLPDGQVISAKICQSDGKGIMSNPNKDLGNWDACYI